MTERKGATSDRGTPLTLLGDEVRRGQKAPDFAVRTGFKPGNTVTLATASGKVRVFNVVPSLDTAVCEIQTIRFNDEVSKLGDGVEVITISMDLPPAQGRFCRNQLQGSAKVRMASDYADKSFGMAYGILIKEWQVLGRGIFVVDRNDIVVHTQYCPKIEELPDFKAVLDSIASALQR